MIDSAIERRSVPSPTKPWRWAPDAASALARATWVVRCAAAMAASGWGIDPEPARAVAQELVEDGRLRALDPEWVGERMVTGR